jgi:hypothetical protein
MFESQYNDEMEAEVKRLEAKKRATLAGHPEWLNACKVCARELITLESEMCDNCL